MSKRQPLTFQERLNIDVIRYILSFLNLPDYENSKLYLKECRSEYWEKKIALFKYIYSRIPKQTKRIWPIIYNLKYREMIDCYINKKWLMKFDREKIKQVRKMGFSFILYKKKSNDNIYHLIVWPRKYSHLREKECVRK